MKLPWTAAVLLLLLPGALLSQSLGEIAEQEKAKRKKTGAKSYSNEDLDRGKPTPSPSPSASPSPEPQATRAPAERRRDRFKVPSTPPPPPQAGQRPPSESETSDAEGAANADKDKTGASGPKDEPYWRGQREARENAVAAAEKQVDEAQKKLDNVRQGQVQPLPIDAMTQQPPIPSVQGADYARLQQELAEAKSQLDLAKKSLADLEDEARRAGVPPGWAR
jgi:hypothetical protein